ncbi:MAG TPA: CdvA-like protein [Candidatus Sulfopaludibacter sp.]|nr:CdvA-like protein [Candidatus Sulfopaludibacter sp.]
MSELKLEFVGKKVKDMYGTYIGKVIGIVTDIEGSIEAVGVDCGSSGINNLPYEQLLVQGDYVIFIPRWRLEAQKLLREKSLALKRIKALQEIVAENDIMRDDAEFAYLKYEKRLDKLGESTKEIIEKLHERISELDIESKRIKSVLFDAKLQYKSNEITEDVFQQINLHTNELLDHINLEKTEIKNIMNKLAQQTVENTIATTATTTSSNDAEENAINSYQDENNQQIPHQELNNIIDNTQGLHEEEVGEGVRKELENTTPEITSTNENEHNEINPMITSNSS